MRSKPFGWAAGWVVLFGPLLAIADTPPLAVHDTEQDFAAGTSDGGFVVVAGAAGPLRVRCESRTDTKVEQRRGHWAPIGNEWGQITAEGQALTLNGVEIAFPNRAQVRAIAAARGFLWAAPPETAGLLYMTCLPLRPDSAWAPVAFDPSAAVFALYDTPDGLCLDTPRGPMPFDIGPRGELAPHTDTRTLTTPVAERWALYDTKRDATWLRIPQPDHHGLARAHAVYVNRFDLGRDDSIGALECEAVHGPDVQLTLAARTAASADVWFTPWQETETARLQLGRAARFVEYRITLRANPSRTPVIIRRVSLRHGPDAEEEKNRRTAAATTSNDMPPAVLADVQSLLQLAPADTAQLAKLSPKEIASPPEHRLRWSSPSRNRAKPSNSADARQTTDSLLNQARPGADNDKITAKPGSRTGLQNPHAEPPLPGGAPRSRAATTPSSTPAAGTVKTNTLAREQNNAEPAAAAVAPTKLEHEKAGAIQPFSPAQAAGQLATTAAAAHAAAGTAPQPKAALLADGSKAVIRNGLGRLIDGLDHVPAPLSIAAFVTGGLAVRNHAPWIQQAGFRPGDLDAPAAAPPGSATEPRAMARLGNVASFSAVPPEGAPWSWWHLLLLLPLLAFAWPFLRRRRPQTEVARANRLSAVRAGTVLDALPSPAPPHPSAPRLHPLRLPAVPALGAWSALPPLPRAAAGHAMLMTRGLLYCVGRDCGIFVSHTASPPRWRSVLPRLPDGGPGEAVAAGGDYIVYLPGSEHDRTTPVYAARLRTDGDLERWEKRATLPLGLAHAACVGDEYGFWIIGGSHQGAPTTTVFRLDAVTWRVELQPNLPEGRASHGAVWTPLGLVVAGGLDENRRPSRSVFAMTEKRWIDLPPLPEPRANLALALAGARLLACGGSSRQPSTSLFWLDTHNPRAWHTASTPLPIPLSGAAAAVAGDALLISGGRAHSTRIAAVADVFAIPAGAIA